MTLAATRDGALRWTQAPLRAVPGAASVRVTAAYAVILLAIYLILAALGPHAARSPELSGLPLFLLGREA